MKLIATQHPFTHPSTLNLRTNTSVNVGTQLALACFTLQACNDRGGLCLLHGKAVHTLAIKLLPYRGAQHIYSKLLHFYCKAGMVMHARRVFDEMSERDLMAWTVLIGGFARHGLLSEALALFREMVLHHKPNSFSVSVVLKCCSALGALRAGREMHGYMVRNMTEKDTCSESSLVDFYAKLGLLTEAREVFDGMTERDVISWTIMIRVYANTHGCEDDMLGLFEHMQCSGVEPTRHTLSVMLGCADLELGKQLHAHVLKRNWGLDAFLGSALVDVYAKNGNLGSAHMVFDWIVEKDIVCFNSLISGYGRTGNGERIICLFVEMGVVGFAANQSTYVGMLNGCANMGSMSFSKQLHAQVIATGFIHDLVIQGVVVDMYAKCGCLEAARTAFDGMSLSKSIVAWNSMIGGYGRHGCGEEALQIFNSMETAAVPPDCITFTCLLSACSHSGLVHEGRRLFDLMHRVYGIQAQNEHYCCMVDLLGRAGMTHEAYEFICRMPYEAGSSVWAALLGACRVWRDPKLGEIAARRLLELEPDSSGSYVALANIYAARGRWADVDMIRELMDSRQIRKDPGYSWIEIDNQMHKFKAGETIHTRIQEIRSTCERIHSSICDPFTCTPDNAV
ncbi:pentatricopeptide repeat-containing protein DOT4, chloroplastic-like [Magnolia sinica]|uniref:pentatricopeptide repeat-containing protein DOT4, chloroplastic-like n=1 Tax=Magnolia sinica TaxID=86752 RepID=UPI0026597CC5|nr:pentatricopeptide repeat-containing protein DOT4, chloroplastic-like [Magnolia sinica]